MQGCCSDLGALRLRSLAGSSCFQALVSQIWFQPWAGKGLTGTLHVNCICGDYGMFIQCSDFLSECLDFLKSLLSAQVLSTEQTFFSLPLPPTPPPFFFLTLLTWLVFLPALFPVVVPVSPHRSGHLWMLINTLRLHNSEDCRTLDFLFIIIVIVLFHFILSFCGKKTWRNMLFFRCPWKNMF